MLEVVLGVKVVLLSLHPNHPGVFQVAVVVVVVVDISVVVATLDVVLSQQPHHPGVSHVDVLVLVRAEDVDEKVEVVVYSPSVYFQRAQSSHSSDVILHSGTVSYIRITSLITFSIGWVPIQTLQPKSFVVS